MNERLSAARRSYEIFNMFPVSTVCQLQDKIVVPLVLAS